MGLEYEMEVRNRRRVKVDVLSNIFKGETLWTWDWEKMG